MRQTLPTGSAHTPTEPAQILSSSSQARIRSDSATKRYIFYNYFLFSCFQLNLLHYTLYRLHCIRIKMYKIQCRTKNHINPYVDIYLFTSVQASSCHQTLYRVSCSDRSPYGRAYFPSPSDKNHPKLF